MKASREAAFGTTTALLVALAAMPAAAQEITRVSVDSSGAQGYGSSLDPAVSGDGDVVAFTSYAWNLVSGDANAEGDVFVHDRSTGITELVSISSNGVQGDFSSSRPVLSRDGNVVAFESDATTLVPANFCDNVFVHDRTSGITELVCVTTSGSPADSDSKSAAISADGEVVVFQSGSSMFVFNDSNRAWDIFVRDRTTKVTDIVSINTSGALGNSDSIDPAITADASLVVFESFASNLVFSDTNQKADIFLRDRIKKTTRRLSTSTSGAEADADCTSPAISADGTIVTFCSAATTLVAGDTNGKTDVFIRDRNAAATDRMSVDSSGAEANGDSFAPALSNDGRYVVFWSSASNLDPRDTNGLPDVFIRDRIAGTTKLLSISQVLAPGDDASDACAISDDGGLVAFESGSSNLVLGDTNDAYDVFADDLTVPPVLASWNNYGSGYPGTLGVPTLTSSANPVFGTAISIDAANSSGKWSEGFLFVGLSSTDVPTSAGGDLLVVPLSMILLPLLPGGGSIFTVVPQDLSLYGLTLYLQLLELDPGAQHGLSFTPGLQLTLGQ